MVKLEIRITTNGVTVRFDREVQPVDVTDELMKVAELFRSNMESKPQDIQNEAL